MTLQYTAKKPHWDGTIKENGFWDDSSKCPSCKKRIMFWNSGNRKDHKCTECGEDVTL
ncbi:MAG: hypothetical protein K5785_00765 [Nitrosarchaeum sp.]|nr:hypothetical protein [Nitrosarchaeum sp.]